MALLALSGKTEVTKDENRRAEGLGEEKFKAWVSLAMGGQGGEGPSQKGREVQLGDGKNCGHCQLYSWPTPVEHCSPLES